jgi:exodeoxyribonuclease VII small subunit
MAIFLPMKQKPIDKMSFEEAVDALEQLVQEVEDGEVSLQDLVSRYEYGSKLLKYCRGLLGDAEMRLQQFDKDKEKSFDLKVEEPGAAF